MDVGSRLAAVRARIETAGGDPERITVVAVTKGFGPEAVRAAVAAGLHDVGENYAQELAAKARGVEDAVGVRWHFLGTVQRNKVKAVAPLVHLWQSVDRAELAASLAARSPGAALLVQVNLTAEEGRGGCPWASAPALVAECVGRGLVVRGLMGVGPAGPAEAARPAFRRLRELADDLGLAECSMGMTADLEVAVQEGATMLRIGTALFGPRPRG